MKNHFPILLFALTPLSVFGQQVRLDSVVVKGDYKITIDYLPEGKKCTTFYDQDDNWDESFAFFFESKRNQEGRNFQYKWYDDTDGVITFKWKTEFDMKTNGVYTWTDWSNWSERIGDYKSVRNTFIGPEEQDYENYGWDKSTNAWQPQNKAKQLYDEYRNNTKLSENYTVEDGKFVCYDKTTLGSNPYYQPFYIPGSTTMSQLGWLGEQRTYSLDENKNLVLSDFQKHLHDDYGFEVENWRYGVWEYGSEHSTKSGDVLKGDLVEYYQPGLLKSQKAYNYDGQSESQYNHLGQTLGQDGTRYDGDYIVGGFNYFQTMNGSEIPYYEYRYSGLGTNVISVESVQYIVDEYGYNDKGEYCAKKYHTVITPGATWTFDANGHLTDMTVEGSGLPSSYLSEYKATFDANGRCTYLKNNAGFDHRSRGIFYWEWNEYGVCKSYKHYDYFDPTQLLEEYTIDMERDEQDRLLLYHLVHKCNDNTVERRIENAYRGDEQIKHLVYEDGELQNGWERRYNTAGQCIYSMGIHYSAQLAIDKFEYWFDQYGNVTKEVIEVPGGLIYQYDYEYDYSRPAPGTYRMTNIYNYWQSRSAIFPADTEMDVTHHCIKSSKVTLTYWYGDVDVYDEKYYYSEHTTTESEVKNVVDACLKKSGEVSVTDVTRTVNDMINQK